MNPLQQYKRPVTATNFQLLPTMNGIHGNMQGIPVVESNAHAPRNFMIPLQMERIKTDIASWRLAITEAENAYYPHRFRMQQLFVDMILEGHTGSCIVKLKDMTLLKEFKVGKKNSEGIWVENPESTKLFKKKWFKEMLSYGLDAQFFAYSLIQLGDLIVKGKDYEFKNLTVLKRWHVSPDRKQLVQIPYQTWGLGIEAVKIHDEKHAMNFAQDVDADGIPFDDWMIYVDTPSDTGASICGYGLLYNISIYAIILKNNLAYNSSFNEMFVAPYRHIQTDHQFDSDEYKVLQRSASQMGSFGYLLTGTNDKVEFIQGNTGTGYQSYGDLEKRCQQSISKRILGHANAMDEQKTALGGGDSGKKIVDEDNSPEGKAMAEKEKKQDEFALTFLNDICYPKFKKLGFPLRDDEEFYLPNDKEEMLVRKKEDDANQGTATIAETMKSAGLKMKAKYFQDRTGIPTEEVTEPEPTPFGANKTMSMKMKAKLDKMYSAKHKHDHGSSKRKG